MSEYQYYEFRAVDRPLTQKQMDELRACSSRAEITPTSFVNVYNWGDFKGNPDSWMERYFDAFLHTANWGSRWLMLRIPKKLLDPETVSSCCIGENLSHRTTGDHLILSFNAAEVDDDWYEGESWLSSLILLRSDLMQGDHRCLYLGWLLAIQNRELDDDALEPPVPPGLGQLNGQLQSLADFLDIDVDLVAAAAESSTAQPASGLSNEDVSKWVAVLPEKDKDALLTRLIEGGDPHVATELRQRAIREIRDGRNSGAGSRRGDRRSVAQLLARAGSIAEERQKREAEKREREKAKRERAQAEERKRRLDSLVGKESHLWTEVDKCVATKQPKRYDEAVSLLQDLHDLADRKGEEAEFSQRMSAFGLEHARKTSLVARCRKANLLA